MRYAKVEKGVVIQVIEISSDDEKLIWTGQLGHPNKWVKVETKADIGWTYSNDTFTPPKPHASWVWNTDKWEAPKALPSGGKAYNWDESSTSWKEVGN